jgi:predicted transcriptional regulator
MDGKSVTISVRIPQTLRDKLQAVADERDRTLSQLCMLVLRDYVTGLEKKKS